MNASKFPFFALTLENLKVMQLPGEEQLKFITSITKQLLAMKKLKETVLIRSSLFAAPTPSRVKSLSRKEDLNQ